MNNADIFFFPGRRVADFILSLFGVPPMHLDPSLYWVMSFVLALVVWSWVVRIAIAVVKKTFGFESRPRY